MMMYDMSSDYKLREAIESIRSAQQVHRRELEKKDETIQNLQKQVESFQLQKERDYTEFKRITEKDVKIRDLLCENKTLKYDLAIQADEIDRLKEEIDRLRTDIISSKMLVEKVEGDHEKAKHIISILLSKLHGPTPPPPPPTTATTNFRSRLSN